MATEMHPHLLGLFKKGRVMSKRNGVVIKVDFVEKSQQRILESAGFVFSKACDTYGSKKQMWEWKLHYCDSPYQFTSLQSAVRDAWRHARDYVRDFLEVQTQLDTYRFDKVWNTSNLNEQARLIRLSFADYETGQTGSPALATLNTFQKSLKNFLTHEYARS
jgi:hypothetical protein